MISRVLRVKMSAFYTAVLLLISFLSMSFSSETTIPQPQLQLLPRVEFSSETTIPQPQIQLLPRVDSNFRKIIMRNSVYIDKTQYVINILNTGATLCFVTRPRRFGKTLFLDMMYNFFEGKCSHFFDNLSCGKDGNSMLYREVKQFLNPNFTDIPLWVKYPVIRINFNGIQNFNTFENFEMAYKVKLQNLFNRHKCQCRRSDLSIGSLISRLYLKFNEVPVIVLVDEYDFPFHFALENLKDLKLAEQIRIFINQFLNEIKADIDMLGFVFVTGVTKIPLDALQSGPNNFNDFTHGPELAQAFGLSKSEIQTYLSGHVKEFGKMIGKEDWNTIFQGLIDWYDGYRFVLEGNTTATENVLNPVSTITCLKTGKLESHWSATSSLNYVLKSFYNEFSEYNRFMFDSNYQISSKVLFRRYDLIKGPIPLPVWMFQCGYLTIVDYYKLDSGTFVDLKYPNKEIRTEIRDGLVEYIPLDDTIAHPGQTEIKRLLVAFQTSNLVEIIHILRRFGFQPFVHPSKNDVNEKEITRRLQTIFKFAALHPIHGQKFQKEKNPTQDAGDIDFLIGVNGTAYVISTKCHGKDPNERAYLAMEQLVEYANDHPINFWKCVHEESQVPVTSPVIFLALGFGYDSGGKLADWASLAYVNKSALEKSIEVDDTTFGSQLRNKIKKLLSPVKHN